MEASSREAGLTLRRLNPSVFRVDDAQGRHVGYLKFIQAHWKFKAIGYNASGNVVPGGGPLTDHHNQTFVAADEALVSAGLLGDRT